MKPIGPSWFGPSSYWDIDKAKKMSPLYKAVKNNNHLVIGLDLKSDNRILFTLVLKFSLFPFLISALFFSLVQFPS